MSNREWETMDEVLYGYERKIDANEVIETYIVDHETYERMDVKAIISRDPTKLPDGEKLWVRDFKGRLKPEPWSIKIVEVLTPSSSVNMGDSIWKEVK
jgi:hypothetical protein